MTVKWKWGYWGTIAVGLVLGVELGTAAQDFAAAPYVDTPPDVEVGGGSPIAQQFAGSGQWQGQQNSPDEKRPWRIHAIQRADGSLQAKLSVLGVAGFESVTVEGQVIGQDAFGVLLDDAGNTKATFNAKIFADGSGGSFVLGSGEGGMWEYDAATRAAIPSMTPDTPAPQPATPGPSATEPGTLNSD